MSSPTSYPPAAPLAPHPTVPANMVPERRGAMAIVEIRVPPDLRVESDVEALLGSAEVHREVTSTTSPDAPTVRITGSTFLGSIEIKVIDPNAPGLLEKIRRRITGA